MEESVNTIFLSGIVIKRRSLNRILGFFHVKCSKTDHIYQVRIKVSELKYLIKNNNKKLIISTLSSINPIIDNNYNWPINIIHIGTYLIIEGYKEITSRLTERIIVEKLTIIKEEILSNRNLTNTIINKQGLCKQWAKKCFYDENCFQNQKELFLHWNKTCINNNSCSYRHYWININEKKSYFNHLLKIKENIELEYDPNDPFIHDIDKLSKKERAKLFALWISNIIYKLNWNNINIIDIAGGSGHLLKELMILLYPICSSFTLIEPNTRNITPILLLNKVYKRLKIEDKDFDENAIKEPKFYNSFFNKDFYTNESNIELFTKANTIIIGLHPDQATEPIIDCSLYYNISFAVVPCCVFANESPNRKIIENNMEISVKTYSQFIRYLENKSTNIQSNYLQLKGRNKILYKF